MLIVYTALPCLHILGLCNDNVHVMNQRKRKSQLYPKIKADSVISIWNLQIYVFLNIIPCVLYPVPQAVCENKHKIAISWKSKWGKWEKDNWRKSSGASPWWWVQGGGPSSGRHNTSGNKQTKEVHLVSEVLPSICWLRFRSTLYLANSRRLLLFEKIAALWNGL